MIAPVSPVSLASATPVAATPAATPVGPDLTTIVPSIDAPDAFTGDTELVDLPSSATGHKVTIDRILLQPDTTFDLPAGSVYFIDSGSGVGTSRNPAPPSQATEPAGLDVRGPIEYGGSLDTDSDQTAIVTILRIAPTSTPALTSTPGATVFPMSSYTTDQYRFERQVSVVFGRGPVPATPEQAGPLRSDGTSFSDAQGISLNGATMLLYAEQGSIQMKSFWNSISDPASGDDYVRVIGNIR